jgi:hypothetical protein
MSNELANNLGKKGVPIVYGVVKPHLLLFMPAGYLVCEATSHVNLGLRLSFCASFGPRHSVPLQNLQAIAGVLSAGVLKDSMEGFLAKSLAAHAADANKEASGVVQGQAARGEDGGQQKPSEQTVPEKGDVVEAADNKQEVKPEEKAAPQESEEQKDAVEAEAPQAGMLEGRQMQPALQEQPEGAQPPEDALPPQAPPPTKERPLRSAAKSEPAPPAAAAAKKAGRHPKK